MCLASPPGRSLCIKGESVVVHSVMICCLIHFCCLSLVVTCLFFSLTFLCLSRHASLFPFIRSLFFSFFFFPHLISSTPSFPPTLFIQFFLLLLLSSSSYFSSSSSCFFLLRLIPPPLPPPSSLSLHPLFTTFNLFHFVLSILFHHKEYIL